MGSLKIRPSRTWGKWLTGILDMFPERDSQHKIYIEPPSLVEILKSYRKTQIAPRCALGRGRFTSLAVDPFVTNENPP